MSSLSKKEIVNSLINKGLLVNYEFLDKLEKEQSLFSEIIENDTYNQILVLSETTTKPQNATDVNWSELDKILVLREKGKNKIVFENICIETPPEKITISKQVEVIKSHKPEEKKRDVSDFIKYFNLRYKSIERILKNRQELQNLTSISRVKEKKEREQVAIIGMVSSINVSKAGNFLVEVEDPSGMIKVVVNKNKPELYESMKSIVPDEVLGICGYGGQGVIFVNNVIWPDVPTTKELKKSPEKAYAAFLSDIHVGSTNFLEEEFNKFLKWLNGEVGNDEQKEIANNIKYIFIIGDLVDGVGVYPNQETELTIPDVYRQYDACAQFLSKIPKHINIIMCPGNHDALRIAEPQPEFYKDFSKALYDLPNATIVSNPAYINIHSSEAFSGFDVLMYHGFSFDYYVNNVDVIRNNGGYNRIDLVLKFLLQRRHLAPTHTSTLYLPDTKSDPLVIDKVPDFFVTGHIHKSMVDNYKNITLISGSCWQSKTSFQEKVGHTPEPARVPIVNLQTREAKIMRF